MTKPSKPPPGHEGVVEMDAMDVHEWEQGQRTPQTSDANLKALVQQSAHASGPVVADDPRKPSVVSRARVTSQGPARDTRGARPAVDPMASGARPARPAVDPMASGTRPARPAVDPEASGARPAVPRSLPGLAPHARGEAPVEPPVRPRRPAASPDLSPARGDDAAPQPFAAFDDFSERTRVRPTGTPSTSQPHGAMPMPGPHGAPPSPYPIAPSAPPYPLAAPGRPDPLVPSAPPYPLAPSAATYPPHAPAPPPPTAERLAHVERADRADPRGLRTAMPSRRALLWTGGALACIGVAAAVILTSSNASGPVAASDPAPALPAAEPPAPSPPPAPAPVVATQPPRPAPPPRPAKPPPAQHPVAAHPTPAERALPAAPTKAAPRPKVAVVAPARPVRRRAKKAAGKKVVVEYSGRANEAETPSLVAQAAEDPAIGLARGAYIVGNDKLFAGDTDGAILSYREALRLYPGYVGGYRGLGLAYEERGDRRQALEAFRTYVATVPGAKDVPLIKKRIGRLQRANARPPP